MEKFKKRRFEVRIELRYKRTDTKYRDDARQLPNTAES